MRTKQILVTIVTVSLLGLVSLAGVLAEELTGQVVDEQGNRLEGAKVRVIQIPYLATITDADGNFVIDFEEEHSGENVTIWIETGTRKIWLSDLRVSDDMGSLGTITLEMPPEPPTLLSPGNDTTVTDPRPTFRWESVPKCAYNLQVHNHSNFRNAEIREDSLHASEYSPITGLRDGTYYWRVQIERDTGDYSAWSAPWAVRIEWEDRAKAMRNRKAAFRSLLIPGWGQKYKGRSGWIWGPMTVGYVSSLAGALAFELTRHAEYDKYLKAEPVWELLDRFEKAETAFKWRNGLLIAASAIAVLSSVHAYRSDDPRFEQELQADVGVRFDIEEDQIRLVFLKQF